MCGLFQAWPIKTSHVTPSLPPLAAGWMQRCQWKLRLPRMAEPQPEGSPPPPAHFLPSLYPALAGVCRMRNKSFGPSFLGSGACVLGLKDSLIHGGGRGVGVGMT